MLKQARASSEVVGAIEQFDWETEPRDGEYLAPSGVTVALHDGWIHADPAFRAALIEEAREVIQDWDFVRYTSTQTLSTRSLAGLKWSASRSRQSTTDDAIPAYGNALSAHWREVLSSSELKVPNRIDSAAHISDDLLLEAAGEGRTEGVLVHVYVAHRIGAKGTAKIQCLDLGEESSVESCKDLATSTTLPP